MHQKHPPAKTAALVDAGELWAGEMSITDAKQAATKKNCFILLILDTRALPLLGEIVF
jgi:hypothetical protein